MNFFKLVINISLVIAYFLTTGIKAHAIEADIKFAGALTFSPDGMLFVGDNINGAIYAFDLPAKKRTAGVNAVKIDNIDSRIANLLGVGSAAIEINDLAVHPLSQDIYISVSRIGNHVSRPALLRVDQQNQVQLVDLSSLSFTRQSLANFPEQHTTFKARGLMGAPPTPKDLAKGEIKLSSLAIMDMEFYNGELFVAGVAYDNFLSTLRRLPFPFNGEQSITKVETYHIAHDQYETRAPIRAMSVQMIGGKAQLVAAYTCSPLVLIPLDKLKNGAKIAAHTIGDIGNGQPVDMIPYTFKEQTMLFVTNNSRSPQVIPVSGLHNAKTVSDKDFARGPKLDLGDVLPFGPVGEMVMFEGVSLHMDLLSDKYFVSVTRDIPSGSLNLDSNFTFFPNRVHNLVAEYDFPQYYSSKAK